MEELIDRANELGVRIAVDHTFLFTPAVEKIKELIDAGNGEHVLRLMLELNQEMQTSLVIVTHDHSIAGRMDRILVLEDGLLVDSA